MATPAYHLRPNKAVDRFLFVETIRYLINQKEMANYVYYGFGGPYLDDFRILHETFPLLKMVSVEKNAEVFKRQKFHKPHTKVNLIHDNMHSFLIGISPREKPSIIWLDYTDLNYERFEEFMLALNKVSAGSLVRITLRADPKDYSDPKNTEEINLEKAEQFQAQFGKVLPAAFKAPPKRFEEFCSLLSEMLEIAATHALSGTGNIFKPLNSFYYQDGAKMFTLTGAVCDASGLRELPKKLKGCQIANVKPLKPIEIDVPTLSTKEKLYLQKYLPTNKKDWVRMLGYKIEGSKSAAQLEQYAKFYRQYPHFIRAIP